MYRWGFPLLLKVQSKKINIKKTARLYQSKQPVVDRHFVVCIEQSQLIKRHQEQIVNALRF